GMVPGPTILARYGEPVLTRMVNDLPSIQNSHVTFGSPSTTTHLHNLHMAPESDGNPNDLVPPGTFWDHHWPNIYDGVDTVGVIGDPREALGTLWYHDHADMFTAANVYAGFSAFYLLFDERDSGDENDRQPGALRLPSGTYDVPLLFHDVLFDANGQVVF